MSKWKISKHRYYELKHFCLQYPEWVKEWNNLDRSTLHSIRYGLPTTPTGKSSTEEIATRKASISENVDLIDRTAFDSEPEIASYLIRAVTEGLSYTILSTRFDIPCGRDMYYDRYRKFFWLLDKRRG